MFGSCTVCDLCYKYSIRSGNGQLFYNRTGGSVVNFSLDNGGRFLIFYREKTVFKE